MKNKRALRSNQNFKPFCQYLINFHEENYYLPPTCWVICMHSYIEQRRVQSSKGTCVSSKAWRSFCLTHKTVWNTSCCPVPEPGGSSWKNKNTSFVSNQKMIQLIHSRGLWLLTHQPEGGSSRSSFPNQHSKEKQRLCVVKLSSPHLHYWSHLNWQPSWRLMSYWRNIFCAHSRFYTQVSLHSFNSYF